MSVADPTLCFLLTVAERCEAWYLNKDRYCNVNVAAACSMPNACTDKDVDGVCMSTSQLDYSHEQTR